MTFDTKYKPEFCELAVQLMRDGKSKVNVAAALGICKQTLYNWEEEYPDFKKALNVGITASESQWQELGADGIIADGFNTAMYMIQMRNRFGWRATDPQEKQEADKSNISALTEAFVAAQSAIAEVEKMKEIK